MALFSTSDFLLLNYVHRELRAPDQLQSRLQFLLDKGVVERFGRGRGVKYILSRRFYKIAHEKGVYTRKKGLNRETNKALLLKHIRENKNSGSRLKELRQVLPALSKDQVQSLVHDRHLGTAMLRQRGIKPENLPPSEDIKKLERRVKSKEKKIAKKSGKFLDVPEQ